MRGVENSESGCGILNCDIYHLFWIVLGWLHLLLWKLLDDLLDICCMYMLWFIFFFWFKFLKLV